MKVIEMRRQRAQLWNETKTWLDVREADTARAWSAEDEAEYERRNATLDALDGQITRGEQRVQRERQYLETGGPGFQDVGSDDAETRDGAACEYEDVPNAAEIGVRATRAYSEAFARSLRGARLDGPQAEMLHQVHNEARATLQVDSDAGGGFVVASERFINRLIKSMDNVLAIRQRMTLYPCGYAESLGFPSLDSDLSLFTWGAGELTPASEDTGLALGLREFKPRPLGRKLVKISKRMLESPRFDIERLVIDRVNVQLSNTLESAYMTGSGAGQPLGLFTASDDGIPASRDVSTDNTATGIVADNLIEVQCTLKQKYLRQAAWLFHRHAIKQIRKLKDGDGQYLWQPGLQADRPSVILGSPYVLSDYVPNTFTTGQYVGLYGDLKYYWGADASSLTIQRLVEKYAETGQIGLLFDNLAADAMPVLSEAFVRVTLA